MTIGKEGFQNRPDINWNKELGSELQGHEFSYVIPKDPLMIDQFITAAVYKTLSGEEVASREVQRFIHDSPNIQDEAMEHQARGLMEQARNVISGSKGYENEQMEAVNQGKKAKEDISRYGRFTASYDYWMGIVPIKASVSLGAIDGYPQHLLLRAKLSEIANIAGFPDVLLRREVKQDNLPSSETSILDFARNTAERLGVKPSEFLQSMFDREGIIFVIAMNNCGHTNFDENRSAIVYSGEKGHKSYSPEQKFNLLSKKEKKAVQEKQKERLSARVTREIESGKSKAILSIGTYITGNVWYNPEKKIIDGEFIPSEYDSIYVGLDPIISPNTTHQELLDIRRKGQALVKELGFPERKSIDW